MLEGKDKLRADRGALEAALRQAGAVFKGRSIHCPFHDDRHPSGGIYLGEDGAWRFKCQTSTCGFNGDVFDVMSRFTGRSVGDLLQAESDQPRRREPARRVYADADAVTRSFGSKVEAVHRYVNPDTKRIELLIVRSRDGDRKTFSQFRPVANGFEAGAPPKPWPLYNRTRLRSATDVVVVEGEKCVEALAKIGVVATTSPAGAGHAMHADWSPCAGKQVFLWPDADPADPKTGKRTGIEHMRQVAAILESLNPPARVRMLDVDTLNLPPKGDVVEFLAGLQPDDDPADAVWTVLRETAEPTGPGADLGRMLDDLITGKRKSIDWPWPMLSRLSKALFPGTVTLVCGDPGSTKSFLMLQAARFWHEAGHKVAVYELEDSRNSHMLRVLAQISGESGVVDDAWVREHPDETRALFEKHRPALDSFGRVITSPSEKHPTPAELADWVAAQCSNGVELIVIDPITYADFSERPWIDDREFLWRSQSILRSSGSRLILVTHPRKGGGAGKGGSTLDDLAGGAAYPRHAQTVFWVSRKDKTEPVRIRTPLGPATVDVNRVVKIIKSRNGKGQGLSIGFFFDGGQLMFAEQGVIVT